MTKIEMPELAGQNELAHVIGKLIVEMSQDRSTIRDLTTAVTGLAEEIHEERNARIINDTALREADDRMNERIARISREQSRVAMIRFAPLLTILGAGAAWVFERGPAVIAAWQAIQ